MPTINQETLDGLTKAYTTVFNKSFTETATFYDRVAMTVASNTKSIVYTWLGSIPRIREWLGDKIIQGLSQHAYTIVNRAYELTIAVKRDEIEDDQYGIYTPLTEEMGRSAKIWPDELIFELVKAGFDTHCYDSQYFFDADHPVGDHTVSNIQGDPTSTNPAWYLLDTTKAVKPFVFQSRKAPEFISQTKTDSDDVFMRAEFKYSIEARGSAGYGLWQLAFASKDDLNAANFKTLRTRMENQKDDAGKSLAISPKILLVPPALRDAAEELILREKISGSNNTLYKAIEILVVPYL
jgi:phage major head subunit gpT-like protein